jgi:hypothetical protein
MPFILSDALIEDRKWRGSMIDCLGGRWRLRSDLSVRRSAGMGGIRE